MSASVILAGCVPQKGQIDGGVANDGGSADAGTPPKPDIDGDGFPDDEDTCRYMPDVAGPDGKPLDSDGDGTPNACDETPFGTLRDDDYDGLEDSTDDNCPPGTIPGAPPGAHANAGDNEDRDGDGYAGPCDPNDDPDNEGEKYYAGAPDPKCDGKDFNGDGIGALESINFINRTVVIVGEPTCECIPGFTRERSFFRGECRPATEKCEALYGAEGVIGSYFATVTPGVFPAEDICNGKDDDCDGLIDASAELGKTCQCDPSVDIPRKCGIDEGTCRSGTQVCVEPGMWSDVCVGEVPPATNDVCDDLDNNCDGHIDEGFNIGTSCGTGACSNGHIECTGDFVSVRCSTGSGGSEDKTGQELCNGIDDDCDGFTDEGVYSVLGGGNGQVGNRCNQPGICANGLLICNDVHTLRCNMLEAGVDPSLPEKSTLCNGIDDDCDGIIDDGCQCREGTNQQCGYNNTGKCRIGVIRCQNGQLTSCEGAIMPTQEVCNSLDDDCDGQTDEGNVCSTQETPPPLPDSLPPPPLPPPPP